MFQVVLTQPGVLHRATPGEFEALWRALGGFGGDPTPLRYDLNAQGSWRPWQDEASRVDVMNQRTAFVRWMYPDGSAALDTGLTSGRIVAMRVGLMVPVASAGWPELAERAGCAEVRLLATTTAGEAEQPVFLWQRAPQVPDAGGLHTGRTASGTWVRTRLPAGWL